MQKCPPPMQEAFYARAKLCLLRSWRIEPRKERVIRDVEHATDGERQGWVIARQDERDREQHD
jgi:hypothetical protein